MVLSAVARTGFSRRVGAGAGAARRARGATRRAWNDAPPAEAPLRHHVAKRAMGTPALVPNASQMRRSPYSGPKRCQMRNADGRS